MWPPSSWVGKVHKCHLHILGSINLPKHHEETVLALLCEPALHGCHSNVHIRVDERVPAVAQAWVPLLTREAVHEDLIFWDHVAGRHKDVIAMTPTKFAGLVSPKIQ